jgi:PKD domain/Secretion system C-terminal sorting domain
MKNLYLFLLLVASMTTNQATAQITLADFETPNTSPTLTPQGVAVVDNPDQGAANPSAKVGLMNKPSGDWNAFYLTFSSPKTFILGSTELNFKIKSAFSGRVFVKVWNNTEVVTENWSTNYNFMVTANTWTDCVFDVRNVTNREFTRLEININGGSSSGNVYFDDFKLTNPLAGNGFPVASFTSSKPKAFAGDTVIFDASLSYDFNGSLKAYRWDFQDGGTDTGKIVKHKFVNDAIYRVKLTVTDNDNNNSSTQILQAVYPVTARLGRFSLITPTPSVNTKIEGAFLINANYANVYNPDDVKVDALITLPDARLIVVPAFYYIPTNYQAARWTVDSTVQNWAIRFSSPQTGLHKITMRLTDAQGTISSAETSVNVVANPNSKGIIGVDPQNRQYYRRATGEPFYPMGINVAWNTVENYTKIINNLGAGNANFVRYWHAGFNNQQLEWKTDGRFNLGVYSQAAAAMQDSILEVCNNKNVSLQMCIFHHGMFSETVNPNWNDNPYNSVNGGPLSNSEDFFSNPQAKAQTKKLLRYIVARWGYASNLFAWELFNEVQFTGRFPNQTATWRTEVLKWHDEMGQYIKALDAFKHVVTTSADEAQLPQMNNYAGLDNVQYHTYSNTLLDNLEVKDASFSANLTAKSIICGEYGTNNDADVPFDMQRNVIWTGVMSQVPRLMWRWEAYTDPTWGALFKQPAAFVKDEDFTKEGALTKWIFSASNPSTTVLKTSGFSTPKNNYYGYIYDALNQNAIGGTRLTIPNIVRGTYRIQYFMPDSVRPVVLDSVPLTPLSNVVVLPIFSKGMGIKLQYLTSRLVGNKEILASNNKIVSYPNPVKNTLTLVFESSNSNDAKVQIQDMYGRLVKNEVFKVAVSQEVTLNVPFGDYDLASGVYVVQLTNGNKVFTKKIVYQK